MKRFKGAAYSTSSVALKLWTCESMAASTARSLAENFLRSISISAVSSIADRWHSSSARSPAFFSAMSSVRTSDHEVASAGSTVSLAFVKSRTLI